MQTTAAVATLSALGFEKRMHAALLLAEAGDEGLSAGEIARRLDVPANTLSDHLKVLTGAGVITPERRQRMIIYRVNRAVVAEAAHFLALKFQVQEAQQDPV